MVSQALPRCCALLAGRAGALAAIMLTFVLLALQMHVRVQTQVPMQTWGLTLL